jgi:hypothetical protein
MLSHPLYEVPPAHLKVLYVPLAKKKLLGWNRKKLRAQACYNYL